MNNYELNISEEYRIDKVIDAKNTKTAIIMNVCTIVIMLIITFIGIVVYYNLNKDIEIVYDETAFIALIIYFVGLLLVIVMHELIHGLFYKIFTKQKLTFGITWSAAFCGVPNIYVKKKPMIVTSIAPCIIISLLFLIPLFLIKDPLYFIFVLLIFSAHFGGCCGDLYTCYLLIFKYKKRQVLINDIGYKQTIYVKVK